MREGKIDGTEDFTSKGLGQLKSWLEPWFLNGGGRPLDPSARGSVATSVPDLGSTSDGKQGWLRIGASPFDFLAVVYDSTYGHWVSDETIVWSSNPGNTLPTDGVEQNVGTFSFYNFDAFVAAGLTAQFRISGWGSTTYGSLSIHWNLKHYHVTNGVQDITGLGATPFVGINIYGSPTGFMFDWVSLPNPSSPKNILANVLGIDATSTGTSDTATLYTTVSHRWVST